MNEKDSSGAQRGLKLETTMSSVAGALRSGASALLSAAEIWSTKDARPMAEGAAQAIAPESPRAAESAKAPEKTFRAPRPSELLAEARFFMSSMGKRGREQAASKTSVEGSVEQAVPSTREPLTWPPQKLSLGLQGGGSFAAFAWGVLERLLEEPGCELDSISGASAGSVNAVLLAAGLAEGGRERARLTLADFWNRMVNEASFRSLMLLGGFSPAGSSVAFGAALRAGHFDPLDLDPLRRLLAKHINFEALRRPACPKLLIAATRVRDGAARLFRNSEITADVVLASTCPPLVHCAVDIEGEAYWDGGYAANPPLVALVQESAATDLLVVQTTPARDSYVPITAAAIDRRLDQIAANATINAELAALEWARKRGTISLRVARIAAEDEIEGLAQRSAVDLGCAFVMALHRSGRTAADRWLRGAFEAATAPLESAPVQPSHEPALVE